LTKIAIVTDTDSSLPADLAARWGIRLVPITIHFGAEVLTTGVDIDDARLFERIDREGALPTTAAPSPGKFAEAFEAAFSDGAQQILCLCLSSEVSAVYQSARSAAELFPGRDIHMIDSRSLSLSLGFLALEAAEMAAQGADLPAILSRLDAVGKRTFLYASLATLKYLAMSGRVGQITAGLAGLVSIHPVLTIQHGKLEMLEKVRTQSRSWERVTELVAERASGRRLDRLAIVHVNALADAQAFADRLRARVVSPAEVIFADLTPGLSVHAGAGLVGAAFTVSADPSIRIG
jgi:DegV family protein with EDD domain